MRLQDGRRQGQIFRKGYLDIIAMPAHQQRPPSLPLHGRGLVGHLPALLRGVGQSRGQCPQGKGLGREGPPQGTALHRLQHPAMILPFQGVGHRQGEQRPLGSIRQAAQQEVEVLPAQAGTSRIMDQDPVRGHGALLQQRLQAKRHGIRPLLPPRHGR